MKNLVAYFSATGTTRRLANNLAKFLGADIAEIKPQTLYSGKDLNWNDSKSRSSVEMEDKTSRPALAEKADVAAYDTIFLGFPIWWYVAPHIINSYLESADFSGKTIVLFATSGGSGFGNTLAELKPSCDSSVKWIEGRVFRGHVDNDSLNAWVKQLPLQ